MNSLRMSFCVVPASFAAGTPWRSPTAMYIASSADAAHRTFGGRVVGVQAKLRRQVEGDGKAGRALAEQVAEAPVGLLRGTEARVLAHRPQLAAVHRRVHAARVRVLAGQPEPLGVVALREILRRVHRLDGDPAVGRKEG